MFLFILKYSKLKIIQVTLTFIILSASEDISIITRLLVTSRITNQFINQFMWYSFTTSSLKLMSHLHQLSNYVIPLISKFQVGLKSLLRQGLSEPELHGDLVYKLKKIVGSNDFSAQFNHKRYFIKIPFINKGM